MNSILTTERNKVIALLGIYLLVSVVLTIVFDGTGDDGDSIVHYFFSRYAFEHPANFLNHWAKPFFVLLTSIPAQFGLDGMKIFNSLCMIGASWYAYRMAAWLAIPKAWLIPLLVLCTPMSLSHGLSGLTEPLFAFWLTWSLWLILSRRVLLGCLVLSFLPFIRSEGLIVICTLLPFLIWHKKWLALPLLGVGHLVYSIVGGLFYNDFLWVFNKIPYATIEGAYGSGRLFHFIQYFDHVASLPISILLLVGLWSGLRRMLSYLILKSRLAISSEELWLVYGIFVSMFVAHTLFWYLGIFNSFGLMRVLLGVVPVMAIITLRGLQDIAWVYASFGRKVQQAFFLIICGVLIFYLIDDLRHKRTLQKNDIQLAISEILEPYRNKYQDYTLYSDAPYAAFYMKRDWFDVGRRKRLASLYTGETIPANSIAVWDDSFGADESRVSLDQMVGDSRLIFLDSAISHRVIERKAAIFEVKEAYTENYTLYKENFDAPSGLTTLDSTYFFSPPYSQKIHQPNIYSAGPEFFLGALRAEPERKLKVSAMVYYNPSEEEGSLAMPGYLVISHESNYKSFDWNAIPLADYGKPGEWIEVNVEAATLPHLSIEDRLKIYLVNDHPTPVYVDDIKVEWTK